MNLSSNGRKSSTGILDNGRNMHGQFDTWSTENKQGKTVMRERDSEKSKGLNITDANDINLLHVYLRVLQSVGKLKI